MKKINFKDIIIQATILIKHKYLIYFTWIWVPGTHKYLWYVRECLTHARCGVLHRTWPSVLGRRCRRQSCQAGTMLSRRTSSENYRNRVRPCMLLHGSWTCNAHANRYRESMTPDIIICTLGWWLSVLTMGRIRGWCSRTVWRRTAGRRTRTPMPGRGWRMWWGFSIRPGWWATSSY